MRITHPCTRLAAAALTGLLAMAVAAPVHADPPWRGRPPEARNRGPSRGPAPAAVPAPRPAPAPAGPWRAAPPPAPVRQLPPGHGGEPPGHWKKRHHHHHHQPAPVFVAPVPAPAPHVHVITPPPPTAHVQVVVPAPPPPPVLSAGVHVQVGAPAPAPAPVYAPPPPPPPRHHGGGPVSIVGTVRTPHGHPVAGVTMVLAGTSEGRVVTDGAGRYAFTGLRPGSYAVRPNGPCAFGPDVVNLNGLHHGVVQDFNATCR